MPRISTTIPFTLELTIALSADVEHPTSGEDPGDFTALTIDGVTYSIANYTDGKITYTDHVFDHTQSLSDFLLSHFESRLRDDFLDSILT